MWHIILWPLKFLVWLLLLPFKLVLTIFTGIWAVIVFVLGLLILIPLTIVFGLIPLLILVTIGVLFTALVC